MFTSKCDRCPFSEVISDDEFAVKHTVKVAFEGKAHDLCPACYQKFRVIRNHYDNLFNAEIKEWLGRA